MTKARNRVSRSARGTALKRLSLAEGPSLNLLHRALASTLALPSRLLQATIVQRWSAACVPGLYAGRAQPFSNLSCRQLSITSASFLLLQCQGEPVGKGMLLVL